MQENKFNIGEALEPKYMGKLMVTYEMISYLLNLHRDLKFVDIYNDPVRQIVHFVFETDGPFRSDVGQTWQVGEGQEVPTFHATNEAMIEVMREVVRRYDENQKGENN